MTASCHAKEKPRRALSDSSAFGVCRRKLSDALKVATQMTHEVSDLDSRIFHEFRILPDLAQH